MKEHQRLLLDNEEDRVCEFPVCFRNMSKLIQKSVFFSGSSNWGSKHTFELFQGFVRQLRLRCTEKKSELKTHVVVDNVVSLETGSPGIVTADRVEPSVFVDDGNDLFIEFYISKISRLQRNR